MRDLVVGIGECQVSNNSEARLVTYALGSCIAIAIYDPVSRVGGLLHYLLPDSRLDVAKSERQPFMFADTGIPALFQLALSMGAVKKRLCVIAVGGAKVLTSEVLEIGKQNQLAMKKILWGAGVLLYREEVGGKYFRSICVEM